MSVRVAIVGLGAAARNIHLPAYAQLGDAVQVVAGCDVDGGNAARAREQCNGAQLFTDLGTMLATVHPDVVSICTPPALHHELTVRALQHNCHVFCEKPLAENLADVDDVIRTAAAVGRQVVVNTQFPCMRSHAAAREQIGTPAFGRLLFLHAWQTFHPSEETESGWRGSLQRRLCMEFGIHVFELVRFFFDAMPCRVYCHMPKLLAGNATESVNIVTLEFGDGRAASIVLDRVSKGPERYLDMRLDGEFASIHTSIGGQIRFEIGLHTRSKRPFGGVHLVRGARAVLENGTRRRVLATDGMNPFASATAAHFSQFLAAIRDGSMPRASARHHRGTLALALAAYDSAASGSVVDMKDYGEGADVH